MREKFSEIENGADVRTLLMQAELNGGDPELLRRSIEPGIEAELVKQNPKRKVYRLDCAGGRTLYLKLFAGRGPLISHLRFYPRLEYLAARRLEKLQLPVIRYLAWGRFLRGGFCLSEGIPGTVPARQYFFQTARHRKDLAASFLTELAEVTRRLRACRIHHPDFHLGNILWSAPEGKLYLADPWGVHRRLLRTRPDAVLLCLPWLELRGCAEEAALEDGLCKAGLAEARADARVLLDRAAALHERRVRRHWNKLSARILSGKSKFATEIELGEGRCSFRHTEWFAPPEKFEIDPGWRRQDFASEEASRPAWIESFLLLPPPDDPPLARLVRKDGTSALFYARGRGGNAD
ncbi:MAG: hypothetical protein IJS14_05435 [Lentisphaeria bacterium]|nr:hypothetical protein [Lentisphaeria bacterium]